MEQWQPASPFEGALHQALTADEPARVLEHLRSTELAFPLTEAAFAGDEAPRWPTTEADELTWIVAYTSVEAMRAATDQAFQHARASSLAELAAGWPDPSWLLAVNPGLPIQVLLDPATVARVAAPSLLEDREAEPAARTPLMQKLLRPADIQELLGGVTRVSGYCQPLADVSHIATPAVLAEALLGPDDIPYYVTAQGAVNMLRWPAVGLELYRSPYGGTDEAARAAVDGWLIEEPPFVGLGFAPNRDQLIREYKIDGIGLPRAVLDADAGGWQLVPADLESAVENQGT